MITYTNIIRHDNLPFEDYLKLGGFSHSFLKREKTGITEVVFASDMIRIGKQVDAILTDPKTADFTDPHYPFARNIAAEVRANFGDLISVFQKQISYTADLSFRGFTMPVTGRLDFLLPRHAVIDLKVTASKTIDQLISFMGYENQIWHYCHLAGVPLGYILIYSIPLKKTFIRKINCSGDDNFFFAEKCLKFGKVAA